MGDIVSNKGLKISEDDYYEHFSEHQVGYAMAKQTRREVPLRIANCGLRNAESEIADPRSEIRNPKSEMRNAVMMGALARVNLKYDQLFPETRELAEGLGFKVPDYNPFHNNLAQAIEIVHGIEDCIQMIESLDPKEEKPRVEVRAGEAGAITEAPRGLDHHWYAINRRGIVEKANIVTPTAHNFLSIEKDLKEMTDRIADRPIKEIKRWCELLVRAYDPCFSCSVH